MNLPNCYRCGCQPCECKDGITLYHADCRDVLPLLEPGSVDLVLTDPPYDIHAGFGGGAFGKRHALVETGGFTDGGVDYGFLEPFPSWFCFCSLKQLHLLLGIAATRQRMNLLTWCKTNPLPTCCNKYLPDVEYIVHGFGKGRLFGDYGDKSTFHVYPCGGKESSHPNEKPIPVVSRLVRLGTQERDTILDPFAGSGTTLRAAKDLGRKAIGIEIKEKYCRIAANRLRQEVLF